MPDLLKHADLLRLDAAVRLSPAELKEKQPELLDQLRALEAERVKEEVAGRFADAPEDLRKAVEEVPVAAPDGGDVKEAVIAALVEKGVREADVKEAELRLADLPTDGLTEELPLVAQPQLGADLAKARLHRLVSISDVPDEKADAITDRGLTDTTVDDATLDGLVEVGELTRKDADELGATVGLYRMLDEDPALTERVKSATIAAVPGGKVSQPRDLVHLREEDWVKLVKPAAIEQPGGLSVEQHAKLLSKRTALAFPLETINARAPQADAKALRTALGRLKPVLADGVLTGDADVSDRPKAVQKAAEETRRFVDSHPGLGLGELLEDTKLSVPQRVKRASERIGLVAQLADANPDLELLGLDFSPGSADVQALSFTGIPAGEREFAIEGVKAQQRLLAAVHDPEHVPVVAAAGYSSSLAIVRDGREAFTVKTGLAEAVATRYFDEALGAISSTSSAAVSIFDAIKGGFGILGVGNLSPGIENYFREIDGWEDLFGSQDYCACEHCASILSPAAYFVDLMQFVEQHLTDRVFTGDQADHVLALPVRRPDLWTLPLTCENTNTEIPLLVIVNEVLENYIARRGGFSGNLSDRAEVWRRVYRDRLRDAVDSFKQPFMLPLERVEAYLAHFGRTRAEIARAVGRDADAVAAAALSLSTRERDLIVTPNEAQSFLRRVYGVNFTFQSGGAVAAVDAQELLKAIDVTRDQLGDLVATRFAQGTGTIEVRSERSSPESVQNDVERVHGLRVASLDRIHRLTRLWRATGWTVRELDLVLTHLRQAGLTSGIDAGALRGVVRASELAGRFKVAVEETTVLFDALPRTSVADGKAALFDRLFNLPDFVKLDGTYPKDGTEFVHPALRDDPAAEAPDHALQRLLAGLRVDADKLHQLILGLAQPLGVDPAAASEADRGFALTAANLSLLYRHARLAQWLRLAVPDLFRAIEMAPGVAGGHVASLDELSALLDFADWLKASKLPLDDVAYAIGAPVSDPTRHPLPADVVQRIVDRVELERPLTFGESIFTFVEGVSEASSRAILAANGGAVVRNDDGSYRLADGFDPSAALTLPAGVTAPESALRALLVARHASQVVPAYLASELRVDVPKAVALVALSGADLAAADLARALRGAGPLAPLEAVVATTLRLAVLLQGRAFDAEAVDFVRAETALFGLTDPEAPTLEAVRKLDVYRRLAGADRGADLRAVLGAFDPATRFATANQAALARVLEVDAAVSSSLQARVALPATGPEALEVLRGAAAHAAFIGVDGAALADVADTDYDRLDAGANAVLAAFRAKYPDEQKWNEQIEPFEARILNRRRDGLCDYLIHTVRPQFETRADLYRYFLLDVDVDGCFKTSRVVAATGSLQLYVHRVLMNLEQDQAGNVHVEPSFVPREEWDWRKHYRVWEANRKVFLWAENYLYPDLRDDKTPLFDELEAEVLQKELDEQSVLDAYSKYLEGFQEVSKLEIAGSYHEIDAEEQSDVLHLFGVTAGDPPTYYYRRVENARYGEIADGKGVVWGPWLQMDVKIPVRRVAPVVHHGRLHVFWIEIVTTAQNDVSDAGSRFVGYTHKLSLRYTTLRLDGRWTPPQRVSLYGPHPFYESDGVIDDPLIEAEELQAFIDAISNFNFGLFGIFSNFDETMDAPPEVRDLFTPRYDDEPHTKGRDGYTLRGPEWERVYPEATGSGLYLHGAGYQMRARVDMFAKVTRGAADTFEHRIATVNNTSVPAPLVGLRDGVLFSGSRSSALWSDYAFADLVADSSRFDRVLRDWSDSARTSASAGVWATPLAITGIGSRYEPINGSLSDGILEVAGDVYLLQSSVRDGARWLLKRLGTTIAESVSRALFTRGVDGLLDLGTQQALAEPGRSILTVGNQIEDAVVSGTIDYTGPYGTYYREIFFHIPFLIAQTLNAQGKFAAAQRWFQFIFDPTSSEVIEDLPLLSDEENAARKRDRNWRYREFRGLDVPTLREILTDAKAIEAYKTDPFNPHAIARLRLSAYQKAIVMRYIDNLLDWADELFTQFQMETVNEAMMLYVTAADILGDRPAVLGECGEAVQPKTYRAIKPFLGRGADFLIELEHWTYVRNQRAFRGKQKALGKALDKAKAVVVSEAVFGLPEVREAGIVSGAWADKVAMQVIGTPDDLPDESKLLKGRLKDEVGAVIGSSAEPIVMTSHAAAIAAATVGLSAGIEGMDGRVLDEGALAGRLEPFAGELTATVKWNDLAKTDRGSRYEPAAKGRLKDLIVKEKGVHPFFAWSLVRQISPAFCVPQNRDLIAYWNRLEDRLFKVRNCMDITGARRKLSLFAPEIDPMMLVRARAAGLSLDEVLDAIGGEVPPYRFAYLLEKAKSFAATVQAFGSSVLGALERKDGEELNELRVVHQQQLLALTTDVRHWEYETAVAAVEALERRREAVEHRRDYYRGLVDGGLNAMEWTQRFSRHASTVMRAAETLTYWLSGGLALIPQAGSPFAMKYGGVELSSSARGFAAGMRTSADLLDQIAASAALEAGFDRRDQGWERDLAAAEDDLREIESQIEGAELRREIAERAIEQHEKTLEQTDEVYQLYRDRFTSVGLYTWLAEETQRLHREAYNAAYALKRLAERAYHFERDDDAALSLETNYWDASKAGLRAGERLLIDLQRLEQRYLETNYRTLELDQSFSLLQLDPAALVELRETGSCEFDVPEMAFDMFYPGHYRRRIRNVRLTIPSITGPYTNVSATLRMVESRVRRDPELGEENLVPVPLPRTSRVATSTAQNDGGVFEMSFRDERYMPFEGGGAVSRWRLELPASFRQFDYQTINDVILSMAYTALEDGALRTTVEDLNASVEGSLLKVLEDQPLGRLFSLRQDFSAAFSRLLHSPPDTPVTIEITDRHFPPFLAGRSLTVAGARLVVRTAGGIAPGGLRVKLNGSSISGFAADAELGDLPSKNAAGALSGGIVGEHTIEIDDPGALAPESPEPGDDSALDENRIADLMLYVETQVG